MALETRKLQITQTDNMLDIRFSSCLKNIDAVCRVVTRFLLLRLASMHRPDQLFAVNLVMREGLTNAVIHGNKQDITKDVRLSLKIVDEISICLEIEDQGTGFDWLKHKGSTFPLAAEHGRGIPIMGTYFTRYAYNEKGNILFLQLDFTSRI